MGLFLLSWYLYDTCFDSTTDINEKLIKIKWKIRCEIGVEENDSSAYLRFTSHPPKNYILRTKKQSQKIAIIIDDVVILWYHIKKVGHENGDQNESVGNEL